MSHPGSALELLTSQQDAVDEPFGAIAAIEDRAGKVELVEDLVEAETDHAARA